MASMHENRYKLLARFENKVQEVRTQLNILLKVQNYQHQFVRSCGGLKESCRHHNIDFLKFRIITG